MVKKEPTAYTPLLEELVDHANCFVAALSTGNTTTAITCMERYGQSLAALAAAASMPITAGGFAQTALLAKEMGGAVKPSSAGDGNLAIAMFATPEAAALFVKACVDPLVPLSVHAEPLVWLRAGPGRFFREVG